MSYCSFHVEVEAINTLGVHQHSEKVTQRGPRVAQRGGSGVLIHPTHPVCVMRERVRPSVRIHVCTWSTNINKRVYAACDTTVVQLSGDEPVLLLMSLAIGDYLLPPSIFTRPHEDG